MCSGQALQQCRATHKMPVHGAAFIRSCGVTNTPCLGLRVKKLDISRGTCPGDSLKVNLCKHTQRNN